MDRRSFLAGMVGVALAARFTRPSSTGTVAVTERAADELVARDVSAVC